MTLEKLLNYLPGISIFYLAFLDFISFLVIFLFVSTLFFLHEIAQFIGKFHLSKFLKILLALVIFFILKNYFGLGTLIVNDGLLFKIIHWDAIFSAVGMSYVIFKVIEFLIFESDRYLSQTKNNNLIFNY